MCPVLNFPVTYFSGKVRRFNSEWYKEFKWLEYCISRDAAFCFPCRMFGSSVIGECRPEKTFTEIGFQDWRHARGSTTGILKGHNDSKSHKAASVAWDQFKASCEYGTVAEQLGSTRAEQVQKNRHYIKTVIEVLLLTCKQEISLSGHDETASSCNFLEVLSLVASHDKVVEERLSVGPRNAKYTSHMIQNELISIMASLVRKAITSAVQKASYYSVLADETKDLSKQEQMSIVLRYVDTETASVTERFLTFIPAMSLNAEILCKYILDTLDKFNIDPKLMISQGYDGASVMSGHCSGVQQRVREVAPNVIYMHCNAHILNLVLVDCVKISFL